MLNETEYMFSSAHKKAAGLLAAYVYKTLRAAAEKEGDDVCSYSSTLSFVCFNKISGKVMTFLLGDSLIYLISDGIMSLACSPEILEDSKTYTTTTEGAAEIIDINIFLPEENSTYLLATDGAWKSLYSGGTLSEEAEKAVKEENIIDYLEKQHCVDDCSVAILEIPKGA